MRAAIQHPACRVTVPSPWFVWLPGLGVVAFGILYAAATAAYSQGTEPGYDHLSDYWCDLLALTSSNGRPNQARPFALLGTCVLPVSLIPFWYNLPWLFVPGSCRRAVTRSAGAVAMLCATLIGTSLHDLAINVVALFGFIAVAAVLLSIDRRRHRSVLMAAWTATALALANYVLWATQTCTWVIPGVQKAAFVGLFVWVGVASSALGREIRAAR